MFDTGLSIYTCDTPHESDILCVYTHTIYASINDIPDEYDILGPLSRTRFMTPDTPNVDVDNCISKRTGGSSIVFLSE